MTPAKLIESYLQIRERKRLLESKHKDELKPFNETLASIEVALGKIMEETGLDHLPGGGGTAYRTVRSNVTVADWDAFLSWVREHDYWHLLEHRASKTAVVEVLSETSELPPGVNISHDVAVQVRKT